MDTKIPALYKTLLAFVLVAGPLIWLLFTPDGQRRADLVLLPLMGRPNVEASLTDLRSDLAEDDVRALLPQLDLHCAMAATPLGERACSARIGSLGRLPAEALVFFFSGGRLSAAKLVYRRDVQPELVAALTRHLGPGQGTGTETSEGRERLLSWGVEDGILVLNAGTLLPEEEPALLWLSRTSAQRRQGGAGTDAANDG